MSVEEQKTIEMCRLCAKCTESTNENDLFQKANRTLLQQIKDLTGITIQKLQKLPRHICFKCKEDLARACEIRLRIIECNNYFKSKDYKKTLAIKNENNSVQVFDTVFLSLDEKEVDEETLDVKPILSDFAEFEDGAITAADCIETSLEDISLNNILKYNERSENVDIKNESSSKESTNKLKTSERKAKEKKIKVKKISDIIKKEKKSKEITTKEKKPKVKKLVNADAKEKLQNLVCEKCGSFFQSRPGLDAHLLRHTEVKKFACDTCEAKFFSPYELQRHIRSHTGESPYQCRHCEKRFRDYSHRQRHERSKHLNIRPFSCAVCGKSFTNNYIAKNHMLTHTKLRAFECKFCEKYFLRHTHLVTHYRSITHKNNVEKFEASEKNSELMLKVFDHYKLNNSTDVSQK